ncbi:MAG: DUF883 C-terminal domain-containing protein [Chloroherpetonaceae bacterium]|nr:DUF883 C-terminal domain-containing protein [Chloroherpetonaceae bacterium]
MLFFSIEKEKIMLRGSQENKPVEPKETQPIQNISGVMKEYFGNHHQASISNSLSEVKNKMARFVKENPGKSAMIALGVGVILGWMFSSAKENKS